MRPRAATARGRPRTASSNWRDTRPIWKTPSPFASRGLAAAQLRPLALSISPSPPIATRFQTRNSLMTDSTQGPPKRASITDQEALQFHSRGRPGKLEIVATKPMATQRDLSLAYSPGVAVPVKAIAADPSTRLRLHRARQHGRGHHQRHRHSRPRQSRRAGGQAGDGGQGGPVQALRRHRLDRSRSRHRGPRRIHQRRASSRALVRRHQSRGHQGAGVLHHRRAPARS